LFFVLLLNFSLLFIASTFCIVSREFDSSGVQQKVNMFAESQMLYISDVIVFENVKTIASWKSPSIFRLGNKMKLFMQKSF
jgi:hypothetical protein